MNIKRLVRKIKYLFDKKDIIYPDELNRYLTTAMFDSNDIMTVIRYVPERDSFIILSKPTKLLQDM